MTVEPLVEECARGSCLFEGLATPREELVDRWRMARLAGRAGGPSDVHSSRQLWRAAGRVLARVYRPVPCGRKC